MSDEQVVQQAPEVQKPRRKRTRFKTETIAVRVVPRFKRILEQLAMNEGLDLSAWMRNLILKELKSRGIIKETAPLPATPEEMIMEIQEKPRAENVEKREAQQL